MKPSEGRYKIRVLYLILSGVLCFNIYYFVIRNNVFDFEAFSPNSKDDILEKNIYKDLSEEYSNLNKLKHQNGTIVFLGDSITKRFNLNEFFPQLPILNRGIFFDTTLGVLNRVENNTKDLSIKKIFIMVGYNDLKFRSDKEIINNISKIIGLLEADNIYIQSLLPVDANRENDNKRIDRINREIKKFSFKRRTIYIDLNSAFKDNADGLSPIFSRDGVHPNYWGYKLWAEIIHPYLFNE